MYDRMPIEQLVQKDIDDLRTECTNPRIDWNRESPVHGNWAEWKGCIGPETRGLWHTFTDDQKVALATDALARSKEDYVDF